MKKVMLTDFKERVKDLLDLGFLMKTVALDPRFKNMKVVDNKKRRETVFKDLEDEMGDHLQDQKEKVADVVVKDSKGKKRKLCLDFDESDDEESDTDDNQEVRREIENYKAGGDAEKTNIQIPCVW